ncbi:TRIC cation channel family protein [Alicyclobacillus fastidiosus]|uniref:TRIC cation channel family protein n=1 Tax=Alicyclobacillus fastidiosus TaxID=392011 RepID=A0ABY6ZEN7_9BACL|nr:TRIC cation channel family protein [Alicyclobacillus fastidiosus]WAH40701.1 TRIC cation channel family protein [Alicyclobacillus fastidiosus]GMA62172.1 membrane protein [Alicyclobacillus fastidiosus]
MTVGSLTWLILHGIGTCAYAASGAFVALQARYRLTGVFILGLTTSFGGGVIRNTIIGVPVIKLWDKDTLLLVVGTLTVLYLWSSRWIHQWKRWGLFFDSIGLASFSLQGALYAGQYTGNVGMTVMAALFTGIGGGVIRDLLAGRKPIALLEEVHAILTVVVGLAMWVGRDLKNHNVLLLGLFTFVVVVRMYVIGRKSQTLGERYNKSSQ